MRSSGIWLCGTLLLAATANAAPTGRLGVITKGSAAIVSAASGRVQLLPKGARAWRVSISPQGDAVYFVTPKGQKEADRYGAGTPKVAYLSRPPYRKAQPLPKLMQQKVPGSLWWNSTGTELHAGSHNWNYSYWPPTNTCRKGDDFVSASKDGSVVAWGDGKSVSVRNGTKRARRVLFSSKNPQSLFDAIKRAKKPKNLQDLTGGMDESLWKDQNNWSVSDPAVAPDGSRLYFAANAGTGMGAAGNTTFALFAFDLKTDRLAVMSIVGALFGRIPDRFVVSADGRRLLMTVSVHDSAADNSYYVLVVDLLTQKSRQLLDGIPAAKGMANTLDSAAWSPDGKYVALSAYFYDVEALTKRGGDWEDPTNAHWTTYLVDAGTGKLARKLAGMREVSWGR